jgi:hypothetical protein
MLRVFLPYEIIFIERNIFHVLCPRKFFDEFSGCHGNYVNKSIICYFIIAIKLTDEFIRVRCFNKNNTAIYTNVFSFVPTKRNVEERCAERVKKYSKNKTKIEELKLWFLASYGGLHITSYLQ